jgi:hypothetical protein
MGKGTRLVLCCALALLLFTGAASADTLTVQLTTDDAGSTACTASGATAYSCPTLRDAVDYAGAGSAGTDPTVQLGANTYTLDGELQITGEMTIVGTGSSGAGATVIKQSQAGARVISDSVDTASLTLEELEVTGGRLESSNGSGEDYCDPASAQAFGGGICSEAPLIVIDAAVVGNSTTGAAGNASNPAGDPAVGAAIYATEGLTLTDSSVSDDTSSGGGGLNATSSLAAGAGGDAGPAIAATSVSVTGSTISGNVATGGVGGAGSSTPSTAAPGAGGDARGGLSAPDGTVSASTVWGNVATGGQGGTSVIAGGTGGHGGGGLGGGLSLSSGATISGTTVAANRVVAGTGGGGGTTGASGAATGGGLDLTGGANTISASTIAGNSATTSAGAKAQGGGLAFSGDASAAVVNTTVFGNEVSAPGGDAYGGGVDAEGSGTTVTLSSDTIDGNQASASTPADTFGGAISSGTTATVTLKDTILASSSPGGTHNCATDGGTITDGGHNLEDDASATCGLHSGGATDDLVGANPELPAALGANGGPTGTLAPAPGSPVINAGGACTDPTLSPPGPLATDQRGDPRGPSCDIGAFQAEPLAVTGAPTVGGRARTESTVVCAQGSLSTSGDGVRNAAGAIGAPAVTYEWLRNGTPIRNANAGSFQIPQADVHDRLSCNVRIAGAYGSGSAASGAVTVAALRPLISKLSQTRRSWRESGRSAGTAFRFTLNEPAKVTLTFNRGRRRRGTMTVNGRDGKNDFRFKGRLSRRHRLAPGRYTVTLTATATGLRSNRQSLTFTIR